MARRRTASSSVKLSVKHAGASPPRTSKQTKQTRNYGKTPKWKDPGAYGNIGFGMTGLTGES